MKIKESKRILPASPFKTDGWGREKSGNNLPIRVFMMSYKGQRRMTMHMKSSEERKKTAIEVIRKGGQSVRSSNSRIVHTDNSRWSI
jgi:hypothetical protein